MLNWRRMIGLLSATVLLLGLLVVVGAAQTLPELGEMTRSKERADSLWTAPARQSDIRAPIVRTSSQHDLSPALRSITPEPPPKGEGVKAPRFTLPGREPDGRVKRPGLTWDPILQGWQGPSSMPAPIQSFEGLGNDINQLVAGGRVMPPDTQGDVGPRHYVQWVNLAFAVWDKAGNLIYGPAAGNTLWSGFGGPCENTNDGDPITLYDPLADRWLMSQFALPHFPEPPGPFYQCIAVSATGDPMGSWYRYAFEWENGDDQDVMNDYPKFGVWPDAYYMTANQFTAGGLLWAGTGVAALERTQMLQGKPARMVYFDLGPSDWGGMLPSDLDGSTPPPPGSPGYFVEAHADEWDALLTDSLQIYEFRVDWTDPDESAFTPIATLPMEPFDGDLCDASKDCIPQPGTAQKLDAIADRLMHRLQYRNFGSHESLVANLTVDVDGTDHAGIRWFELRRSGDTWSIYQQGTYAPDSDHRWMGSSAMDKVGNIALGYSVSGGSTYPSIRYAGRLSSDPLGTLPQAEAELVAGSSFQSGGNRWGDYSMMALDPVDDCTFWYTQEYVFESESWGNWSTRIGSFVFPSCLAATGALEGTVEEEGVGTPIIGARVVAETNPTYVTYSQLPDARYRFPAVPTGTYTVTAEAYGYEPLTFSSVDVLSGSTTLQDFALTPAEAYVLSGTVTDATTGWPLYASITLDGYPGEPAWTDPATGFYSVTLVASISYTAHVSAWVQGYHPASHDLGPLTEDRTENFDLDADTELCVAPGYQISVTGVYEPFENDGLPPAGWTVVDNIGNGQVWLFDNPRDRINLTGGTGDFAIVDSDYYGELGRQDTELRTPSLDFSDLATVTLEFDTDYSTYLHFDVADVDVSTNGGISWTNVWHKAGVSYRGPAHEVEDISPMAAGQPDVMVRFRYYDAVWEWWWQVDNVLVGQDWGCQAQSGGLVIGNVYDENTGEPLVGAKIASEAVGTATALATPDDPNVDDAFYVLFSPAGPQSLTAAMDSDYGPRAQVVTVPQDAAVRQNFYLPAGRLAYDPRSVDITLELGRARMASLALGNEGGFPLAFEITEMDMGFEPEGPAQFVEVTVPGVEVSYGPDARIAKRHTKFRPDITFVVRQTWRPWGNIQVLLLTPDAQAGGDISLLQTTLEAFPDLDVTLWDMIRGAPTGADLAGYDVVIVGNDRVWAVVGVSPEAVGDALADYIDAGGKVIDTLLVHDYAGWQLAGRYIDEGYAPFTAGTADMTAKPYLLGTVYDPGHPLLDGVVAIKDMPTSGTCHQDVRVMAGATRLADWDDGEVYVAYNDNVVGVNQSWFHGSNWTGDVPTLMHNAILYLASGQVDWLSVTPISGTLDIASQQIVSITLDAAAPSVMQPGTYLAKLNLNNDTVYGNPAVPVTMTVTAAPVCTETTGVELTLVTASTIYTDTLVEFSASLHPADCSTPYSYEIDYGDGTLPLSGTSSQKPLHLDHTYAEAGIYAAEIAIWNCDLSSADAVTDTVTVKAISRSNRSYLPIVLKQG